MARWSTRNRSRTGARLVGTGQTCTNPTLAPLRCPPLPGGVEAPAVARPCRPLKTGLRRAAPWAEAMRHLVPGGAQLNGRALEVAVMGLLRHR